MSRKSVLVLRTCHVNMSSRTNFIWPKSGYVEAPDWSPAPMCGNGLHSRILWKSIRWGRGHVNSTLFSTITLQRITPPHPPTG